jgi:accessory gene regulator B
MIDKWAQNIAIHLKKHNENVVSVAVMKFALIIIIDVLSVIFIVLLMGYVTNSLSQASLALFGFALLRFFSGGIHVKSAINCILISVILMACIIYIPISKEYQTIIQILSTVIVLIFAPAHIEKHIRVKKKYTPFLKIISFCIVCTNFYWGSSILAKCFFLQSLSLLEFRRKESEE